MPGGAVRTAYSKVSVKSQTVLPSEVREYLDVGPGDRVRYVLSPEGVRIEKALPEGDDPFVAFTEWAGAADEEDYANL